MRAACSPIAGAIEVAGQELAMVIEPCEPVFAGHYPGFPIFPGVSIVEFVHRGALAAIPEPQQRWELSGIDKVRFTSPVFPGDSLTADLRWRRRSAGWACTASVATERGPAAQVRISFAEAGAATAGGGGIDGIKRILPHRYPMLLVDRVVDLVPGERLTALKAVTCNEPWYRELADDADDEDYDYPGVLLLESWCQAAGLLIAGAKPNPDVRTGTVMLFGGIAGVRRTGRVRPGDVVEHRVRLARTFTDTAIFEGESAVGGEVVMEIDQVVMALRPASELTGAAAAGAEGTGG
ncbi:3-hydroxyacyl-ACP dehydratase FabZ family protein [Saccharopolyspora sp. NPDC003752]